MPFQFLIKMIHLRCYTTGKKRIYIVEKKKEHKNQNKMIMLLCFFVFFFTVWTMIEAEPHQSSVCHLLKLSFRFPAWKQSPTTNSPSSPSATPTASVHPATGTPYVERTASPTSPPAWLAAPARPAREKTP